MNLIRNGVIIWHTLYSCLLFWLLFPIILHRCHLIKSRSMYTEQTPKFLFYQRPWTLFKAKASYILFLITGQRSKISQPVTTPAIQVPQCSMIIYMDGLTVIKQCDRDPAFYRSPVSRNPPWPVPVWAHAKCSHNLLLRPPNRYHKFTRIAIQMKDKVFCTIDRKTTLIRKGTLWFRWPLRLNLVCAIHNILWTVSYSHPLADINAVSYGFRFLFLGDDL